MLIWDESCPPSKEELEALAAIAKLRFDTAPPHVQANIVRDQQQLVAEFFRGVPVDMGLLPKEMPEPKEP